MTQGVGPSGEQYFPVFPYTSFTRMSLRDVLDLKAYLFSIDPVAQVNRQHELRGALRAGASACGRGSYCSSRRGPMQPGPRSIGAVESGARISPAHSATARNVTPLATFSAACGRTWDTRAPSTVLTGELAPNITPERDTGIGSWSPADLVWFLQMGLKPDGDDTQGLMSELIDTGYSPPWPGRPGGHSGLHPLPAADSQQGRTARAVAARRTSFANTMFLVLFHLRLARESRHERAS